MRNLVDKEWLVDDLSHALNQIFVSREQIESMVSYLFDNYVLADKRQLESYYSRLVFGESSTDEHISTSAKFGRIAFERFFGKEILLNQHESKNNN